jgi:hypothetical protein
MIMDPNAALTEIRAIVADYSAGKDFDADRLAELVDGLDGWMSKGGYAPKAWER